MTNCIKPSEIKIGKRFRSEVGDLDGLKGSYEKVGLLQPIIITPEKRLLCGLRRLKAWKEKFGDEPIEVKIIEVKDEREARLIELTENLKRRNLSWQDEVRAIAEVDKLGREIYGRKTTGKGRPKKISEPDNFWDQKRTAETLGLRGQPAVSEAVKLTKAMRKHPGVAQALTRQRALQLLDRLAKEECGEVKEQKGPLPCRLSTAIDEFSRAVFSQRDWLGDCSTCPLRDRCEELCEFVEARLHA